MEELAEILVRILKWTIAGAIISGVTLVAVVVVGWGASAVRGWHLFGDSAAAQAPVEHEDPPPPRVDDEQAAKPAEQPVEEQAAPPAASPYVPPGWPTHFYQAAPRPPFMQNNIVIAPGGFGWRVPFYHAAPKRPGWPRRFFGAIGRGAVRGFRFGR